MKRKERQSGAVRVVKIRGAADRRETDRTPKKNNIAPFAKGCIGGMSPPEEQNPKMQNMVCSLASAELADQKTRQSPQEGFSWFEKEQRRLANEGREGKAWIQTRRRPSKHKLPSGRR